jgi:hypothetical protein
MRFHLIDEVESWEAWQRISVRKVTSVQEEYWQQTAGGFSYCPSAWRPRRSARRAPGSSC